jgi:UDP-glucose 4-epimerase
MENMDDEYILVTGGTGFIGSHVVVKLLNLNYNVIIIDNFSNSNEEILDRIHKLTDNKKNVILIEGDIRYENDLEDIFNKYTINLVMNFAALKSVSESEKYPELYHEVNVDGSINLINMMKKHNVKKFIYSSSATVYGDAISPVNELTNVGSNLACNYAKNKYDMEQYLISNKEELLNDFDITILRYFNPIGSHESGIIGEDPNGIPNNIFPYLLRVAKYVNENEEIDEKNPYSKLTIFGDTYDTRDGTCIRDYIHVQDLAEAHIQVMSYMKQEELEIYNVGTGSNVTVLELVNCINNILTMNEKKKIPFIYGEKRKGDLDISYSNVDKIWNNIGFKTKYGIEEMCYHGLKFAKIL